MVIKQGVFVNVFQCRVCRRMFHIRNQGITLDVCKVCG